MHVRDFSCYQPCFRRHPAAQAASHHHQARPHQDCVARRHQMNDDGVHLLHQIHMLLAQQSHDRDDQIYMLLAQQSHDRDDQIHTLLLSKAMIEMII
jgi:hypothetical protein